MPSSYPSGKGPNYSPGGPSHPAVPTALGMPGLCPLLSVQVAGHRADTSRHRAMGRKNTTQAEESLLMCMSDFVSDVWGTDFKQNLHEPVKALLPKPRPRGGGLSGSSLGSWTPQRLPGTEGVGPSSPSRWTRRRPLHLCKAQAPLRRGCEGFFWRPSRSSAPGMATALRPRDPGRARGAGGAERCLRAPRSQGRVEPVHRLRLRRAGRLEAPGARSVPPSPPAIW